VVKKAAIVEPRLKRSLGVVELTLGGVGVILGAGIYALVGEAAGKAGDALWLSFLLAAVMAALTGLSYAELASVYPRAGADYEYTRRAFGQRPGAVVGWVIISGNLIAAAAVSLGFGGYFGEFVDVGRTVPAVGALIVAGAIAVYGVKEAVWASIVLTVIEVGGLLFIVGIGIPHFGHIDLLDARNGVSGILSGASLVVFAYIGFEQVATLSEEADDAPHAVPTALLLSIGITTALYVMVAVAAVSVLGWEALGASSAPLADVAEEVLSGRASNALSVVALFSTFNTVLLLLMAASRLMYGMATTGSLPQVLGHVHPRLRTPHVAVVAALVIASCFSLLGDIGLVAQSANFAIFLGFIAVNLSLIVLRFTQPGADRPFRLAPNIGRMPVAPVLALAAVGLMIANLEGNSILVGFVLVAGGVVGTTLFQLATRR
jgi:APA family basic amino acid/polyamine antiporter